MIRYIPSIFTNIGPWISWMTQFESGHDCVGSCLTSLTSNRYATRLLKVAGTDPDWDISHGVSALYIRFDGERSENTSKKRGRKKHSLQIRNCPRPQDGGL